jgi:hypothetical protein
MADINLEDYPNLFQYGVLAENELTNTGTTVINNGYWYAPIYNNSNTLTAGTQPSGLNSTLATDAFHELNELILDIENLFVVNASTVTNIGAGGGNQTFSPGYYTGTGITYIDGDTITFDGQNISNPQFFIKDTGTGLTFTSVTFVLQNGATPSNIFWISNPTSGAGAFTVTTPSTAIPGIIITTSSTSSSTFTITSADINGCIYSNRDITFTSTGTVNINSFNDNIVCYAKGTLILTKRGFVPIEDIKEGNMVVTKGKITDNKTVRTDAKLKLTPVVWVSKFKVKCLNSNSRPICITKHALGQTYPFKDLYVSPNHAILINGKMRIAKHIVNGTTIFQDTTCDSVEYYHLECENHSAIIANGVLSETYLDVNNRNVFENNINPQTKR